MTRQRKSHLLILALVPVVVFGAIRCADSTVTAPTSEQIVGGQPDAALELKLAKLHKEFDGVGKDHNDALAFVLKNLQRLPEKNRNRRAICETARKAYAEFHQLRFGKNPNASTNADFSKECQSASPLIASAAISFSDQGRVRSDLSPVAESYLDQIADAVDASSSVDDLNGRIASIESSAASNLSYEEAGAVMMVGSVAASSASYWVQNIPAWGPYYLNTPEYSVFSAARLQDAAVKGLPTPSGDWASIWADAKAAAKRAARGDVSAAAKVIIATGVAGAAIVYDVVVGAAATGSIMAVLQM
jgi:hypothetical protein